jgi:hypothetical protein
VSDPAKLSTDYPDIAIHGTEQTAPAAAAILADSLAVPVAGNWRFITQVASTDTARNMIQVAHRNAANNADVELADMESGSGSQQDVAAFFVMAAGERVVVRNKNAGTAALFYQANLYGWKIP